jgi:hypothetical protein
MVKHCFKYEAAKKRKNQREAEAQEARVDEDTKHMRELHQWCEQIFRRRIRGRRSTRKDIFLINNCLDNCLDVNDIFLIDNCLYDTVLIDILELSYHLIGIT